MSTTITHIDKKKSLAPKLRFKGFDDAWKSCTLDNVTQYTKGFAFKSDDYRNYGTRIIRVSDLGADRIKTDNEKIFIDSASIDLYEKYRLISGNIIITTVGSKPELLESAVGRGIFVKKDGEGLLNQNLLKFENIKGVDNGFVMGLINSTRYQLHIKGIARGNANQANITVVDLLQYKLAIPTLPEQQKIASFLSAVDEKIQKLSRKKELLEQYKKGVMQQLFSGKLRFKDENGKAFPKWEEKKLGDVADVKRGAASQHLNYVSDETKGIRLLRINDFLSDGAVYVENTEEMKRYTVRTNDLLIAGTGATAGIIFIVPEKFNNLSFSYNAPRIRVTNAYHTFIYYYLKSDIILKQQQRLFVGNAQPFLDTNAMRGFKIDIPTIDEQKKIADYLSNIDTKIESITKQITQTLTYKKGLLQQLFV